MIGRAFLWKSSAMAMAMQIVDIAWSHGPRKIGLDLHRALGGYARMD